MNSEWTRDVGLTAAALVAIAIWGCSGSGKTLDPDTHPESGGSEKHGAHREGGACGDDAGSAPVDASPDVSTIDASSPDAAALDAAAEDSGGACAHDASGPDALPPLDSGASPEAGAESDAAPPSGDAGSDGSSAEAGTLGVTCVYSQAVARNPCTIQPSPGFTEINVPVNAVPVGSMPFPATFGLDIDSRAVDTLLFSAPGPQLVPTDTTNTTFVAAFDGYTANGTRSGGTVTVYFRQTRSFAGCLSQTAECSGSTTIPPLTPGGW